MTDHPVLIFILSATVIKWIYLDVTSCLLTLTSITLVQREVSSELLSVILTSQEGACLGSGLVRVSDASSRSRTKMTGHSQGNILKIVRINLFNFFIPSNKVTLAVSSLVSIDRSSSGYGISKGIYVCVGEILSLNDFMASFIVTFLPDAKTFLSTRLERFDANSDAKSRVSKNPLFYINGPLLILW